MAETLVLGTLTPAAAVADSLVNGLVAPLHTFLKDSLARRQQASRPGTTLGTFDPILFFKWRHSILIIYMPFFNSTTTHVMMKCGTRAKMALFVMKMNCYGLLVDVCIGFPPKQFLISAQTALLLNPIEQRTVF